LTDFELNKIYCVSCVDALKEMPDNYVDMVVTSPPYNVGGNNMSEKKYNTYGDKLSGDDWFNFMDETITQLIRVTKNYVFFNVQVLSANKISMFQLIGKYKDNIKELLIWNKNMVAPAIEPGVLNSKFELILVFTKNNPHKRKFDYCFFPQGRLNNVLEGNNNSSNKFSDSNAAAFPIYLPKFFILNFSKENDIVLDPFMGTGTTAVASILNNRRYLGFDISQEYIDIANKRINEATSQQGVFDFD